MRATLAETNREIARNSRLIDDIPLGAELIQYEKRLEELHSQVGGDLFSIVKFSFEE